MPKRDTSKDAWTDEQIAAYNKGRSPGHRLIRVGSEVITYSTSYNRRLVQDPQGSGELITKAAARFRKLVEDPLGSGEVISHGAAVGRLLRQSPDGLGSAAAASRKCRLSHRIPKWVTEDELQLIERYYQIAAALGLEVDHIVPITSPVASGFHCLSNLDMLSGFENKTKFNSLPEDL